jgi:hypothetical protein
VPLSTEPWKILAELLRKLLKLIHDQASNKIYITTWDEELADTENIIKKPANFPDGLPKNANTTQTTSVDILTPKKERLPGYLKVRFITPTPSKLPFDLDQLGQELSESVSDELPITLSKNPHACQAVQADCVGCFFGSTKTIDSKTLVPAIRLKLKIPRHVAIGVQWRAIKNEFKKNYDWKQDDHPPQALHFDIDHVQASRYIGASSKLWKKGSTNRLNGLQLRLIPCLGSSRAIALSDNQKANVLIMAAKQQHLINSHTVKVDNVHIMNLDAPVNNMTLRKYLMSRAPKSLVIQRIFAAVDKSWKGNSFQLVTVKPYAAEAMKILNSMIPECLHLYGKDTVKLWFSNTGLQAY